VETGTLTDRAGGIAGGLICVIDLTQTLTPKFRAIELPPKFRQCVPGTLRVLHGWPVDQNMNNDGIM
jgi:hypothetical protein